MTKQKVTHTPGPWRWNGYYLMQDCPRSDDMPGKEDNPYSTPCGYPIADDGSSCGEYNSKIDIDDPDAHLIAAAPDLLAACKLLLDADIYADAEGVYTVQGSDTDEGLAAVKAARAAIAKAEGTEP